MSLSFLCTRVVIEVESCECGSLMLNLNTSSNFLRYELCLELLCNLGNLWTFISAKDVCLGIEYRTCRTHLREESEQIAKQSSDASPPDYASNNL